MAAGTAASEGSRSLLAVARRVRADQEIIRIDRSLRAGLARVLVPYWEDALPTALVPGGMRLFYLDGCRERYLEIRGERAKLLIGDGTNELSFSGVTEVAVDPGNGAHALGGPSLVRLTLLLGDGEHVELAARTGSWPLPAAGSED